MQRGKADKPNLVDLAKLYVKHRYNKPGEVYLGMVHRLDAPVAGVLMLARTSKAAARLSQQFRQGQVEKVYMAITHGCPEKTSGRLVHHLVRKGRFSHVTAPDTPGSRKAALSYELVQTHQDMSLLKINLETGRRHQIRCQLAAIGCPIYGDRHYGADQFLADGRIALFARQLSCIHPTRQTVMTFVSPYPEGWLLKISVEESASPLWTIEDFEKSGFKYHCL